MILIGVHPAVDAEKTVVYAESITAIDHTPAGSLVVLDFKENDLFFYGTTEIPLAVRVNDVREFVLIANTKARYALAPFDLARALQPLADHYLYDIKVLAETKEPNDLESIVLAGIDGILVSA